MFTQSLVVRVETNNQGQYPFPKEVWSPSGGWWSRPANWRSNTIVALAGIGLATFGVWRISARNEVCQSPTKGDSKLMGLG